jgi:hypothetical protein
MHFLPTRLPIIVLEKDGEPISAVREIIMCAFSLCADETIVSSYSENPFIP